MTLDELKARKKELLARKQQELELQRHGKGDELALFVLEEELLNVKAQLRTLTPGKRIGGGAGRILSSNYLSDPADRQQFVNWTQADRAGDAEDGPDDRQICIDALAEARELMTRREWEYFSLWAGGMKQTAIAERMGVNTSTVSRTLRRAKNRVQQAAEKRAVCARAGAGPVDGVVTLDMADPAAVQLFLSCVTEYQAVHLYLYFGEMLVCEEIAALLERNSSTVNRTLHRGLDVMAERLHVKAVRFRNMERLGAMAYQFFTEDPDRLVEEPDPPEPFWGRKLGGYSLLKRECSSQQKLDTLNQKTRMEV